MFLLSLINIIFHDEYLTKTALRTDEYWNQVVEFWRGPIAMYRNREQTHRPSFLRQGGGWGGPPSPKDLHRPPPPHPKGGSSPIQGPTSTLPRSRSPSSPNWHPARQQLPVQMATFHWRYPFQPSCSILLWRRGTHFLVLWKLYTLVLSSV